MSTVEFEKLWSLPPYSLNKEEKRSLFSKRLKELFDLHYAKCLPYKKLVNGLGFNPAANTRVDEYPFLPVRLFKENELRSIPQEEVFKTMTSSGTTGQRVSKIFLDKNAAMIQMKTLTNITSHFLGPKRLPMLIIDSKAVLKDRESFSARGAGILGFSILGQDITYALNDRMEIDYQTVEQFLGKHQDKDILLFGFTSIIWQHFFNELKKSNKKLPIQRGILIHGGGWKKLASLAITNDSFKASLKDVCGLEKVFNYYGMVEQTGSIFMECKSGNMHCSNFSEVIVRRDDFSVCEVGEKGLIELISLLPTSYPGHCLLSEDLGEVLGEDDCPCGLNGKYFKIHGRIENAEIRGCSDTYQAE